MAHSNRRVAIGIVTSDKMNKTRRVEIPRSVKHPRYGKYVRRKTVCHVHDEENDSRLGDTVEIVETRPLSKTKCWKLLRVTIRAPELKAHVKGQVANPLAEEPATEQATASEPSGDSAEGQEGQGE